MTLSSRSLVIRVRGVVRTDLSSSVNSASETRMSEGKTVLQCKDTGATAVDAGEWSESASARTAGKDTGKYTGKDAAKDAGAETVDRDIEADTVDRGTETVDRSEFWPAEFVSDKELVSDKEFWLAEVFFFEGKPIVVWTG